jgi:hypothetical protein
MNWTDKREEPLPSSSGSHRAEEKGQTKAVAKPGDKEKWSTIYEANSLYFNNLNTYLVTCPALVTIKELDNSHFPPSKTAKPFHGSDLPPIPER